MYELEVKVSFSRAPHSQAYQGHQELHLDWRVEAMIAFWPLPNELASCAFPLSQVTYEISPFCSSFSYHQSEIASGVFCDVSREKMPMTHLKRSVYDAFCASYWSVTLISCEFCVFASVTFFCHFWDSCVRLIVIAFFKAIDFFYLVEKMMRLIE